MASPIPADERITVVLIDSTTPAALARCAQQVLRTGDGCELIIVSARPTSLPQHLARRARSVRVPGVDALDAAAAAEACASSTVVVSPTSAAFTTGWTTSVRERVQSHSQVVSVVGSYGRSILVVPRGVTDLRGARSSWLEAAGLRLRASADESIARQTLSAVMIVKDEEEVLDECLTMLAPFVDEIVVYDTGSTDATMDIARRHGTVLVEGYWDDHFGDARNRALQHATGDWILQIDADEVMTGDVTALRRQLDTDPYDQISVTIISTTHRGGTTGLETQPARFFRRGLYRWTGALHEYPLAVPGAEVRGMSPQQPLVRLMHSGYQPERTAERNKPLRNLALSTKELESTPKGDPERAVLLSNQGRTLMWAGRVDEALTAFEELRTTPGNPTSVVMGGRAALEGLLGRHRLEEIEPWLEVMTANGEAPGNVAVYRARKQLLMNEPASALETVRAVAGRGGADTWGIAFDATRIHVVEAAAQISLGEAGQAAELLLSLVRTNPEAVPFDLLVNAVSTAGRPLDEVAATAPDAFVERTLRDVAAMHPVLALAWFEALFNERPGDVRPLVAGNVFAARAGWRVALVWATRAAEAGLHDCNALMDLAANENAVRADRSIAAAILCEYFGMAPMERLLERLTAVMSLSERHEIAGALEEVGIHTSVVDVSQVSPAAGVLS